MSLKKIEWGDIPNDINVKEKDDLGKWIECNLCHIKNMYYISILFHRVGYTAKV